MAISVWIFLPARQAGRFFWRLEFDRLAVHDGQGLWRLRLVEDSRAYFLFLEPVNLLNLSRMADFSFRSAF
jgi:hypothetical protein